VTGRGRVISWVGLLVLLSLVVGGCAKIQIAAVAASATSPSRSVTPIAQRDTCPEALLSQDPAGMTLSDRQLVSFSRTLVGVETLYADESGTQTMQLLSGGYADEVTETYDNLTEVGNPVVAGADGALLKGSLLTASVQLLFWQIPGVEAPCDMHVLIGTNVPDDVFNSVVPHLEVNRT
jgi:hypothetical protein